MRTLIAPVIVTVLGVILAGCGNSSQPLEAGGPILSTADAADIVEVGCGSCIYSMDGVEGCVTAVKIGDTPYLVTGAKLDAHGSGLCKSAKRAKVVGSVKDGTFVATAIALVTED